MSLQDKLDAFKAEFEGKQAPAEVVAVMHRATADLIATGQAERALKVGDSLPSFALPDETGEVISSDTLLAKGPLVITFYRGAWCPYCNFDLEAIEAVAGQVRELGASLVAISPQTASNSRKIKQDKGLSFPVLSDSGNVVADRFGLRFRLPDDLVGIYKQFGIDLPGVNGDAGWTLPMPARFVIDRDGKVEFAEVSPDYTRRPDPEQLLPVLHRLGAELTA